MSTGAWVLVVIAGVLLLVTIYDLVQTKHAILRNFPILGHFRYIFEAVGPELRQYIVTNNDEERPFSRDQRRWVYASSKGQNNYFGFGTDNDLEQASNYLIIKHSAFPKGPHGDDPMHPLPCAKVLGGARGRKHAFRPGSVINTSAMSFGSLSKAAVEAINRGCAKAGALQNTGEGGIAPYHDHGAGLIFQLGTGYFGARTKDGRFDLAMLKDRVARYPVKALEIKLSQGAKPGKGGILPAAKCTPEIAAIRGVEPGRAVVSPAAHSAFGSVDELLDFVEHLAAETGLPVGIKSAIGQEAMWHELAHLMATTGRGVDYIQVDGGEGGTGAAPLVFSDHVALPFKVGFTRVRAIFERAGIADQVVWVGSGRIGFPADALFAFGLGCDMIAAAREVMLAVGCIQAQRCHTGHCPTGVATHNRWLVRGLDPTSKADRVAGYLATFRHELLALTHACGHDHPCEVGIDAFEIVEGFVARSPRDLFGYEPGWGSPSEAIRAEAAALMRAGGHV
ncbi:MAG: FMN-binding glutamate synthase family protein [Deltaproteobacteria bacterium]|nr:MAG: FMN-binding glutamate synthase family protein [Deltaproteobacteria bacterium]